MDSPQNDSKDDPRVCAVQQQQQQQQHATALRKHRPSGILRLDSGRRSAPRRSSGGSVEFRSQPELLGDTPAALTQQHQQQPVTPTSTPGLSPQHSVTWASPQIAAGCCDAITEAAAAAAPGVTPALSPPPSELASPIAATHSADCRHCRHRRQNANSPKPLCDADRPMEAAPPSPLDPPPEVDSEGEDYSVSVSAIMQRRASTRATKRRGGFKSPRRTSSPVGGQQGATAAACTMGAQDRRRSSVYTTSSGETAISFEDGTNQPESTQEQIFENIRLHKEVLQSVKMQPWSMRRKRRLVRQAKAYVARHEGALQERFAMSRSTRDLMARFRIVIATKLQHCRRELANISTVLIPWEKRIKEIESHFGSVVASYFTFLRWLFGVNIVIAVVLTVLVIGPEMLGTDPATDDDRKRMLPEERAIASNLITIWDFEGFLKYSPLFYGYYSNKSGAVRWGYRLPLAYFLTGLLVYIYSFVATLRKMAENSRVSKLSSKDDECVFSWKLFTGWDFMIGHAETAHNRVASVVLGFKEALLEEAEKKKDKRNWKVIALRIIVNLLVLILLAISAYAVVLVVNRTTEPEAKNSWWRRSETTVVMSLISFFFPMIFEGLGFMESYHPRQQLRLQLGRIMLLNLLNLYSLIFALFDKITGMTVELQTLKRNGILCTDCGTGNGHVKNGHGGNGRGVATVVTAAVDLIADLSAANRWDDGTITSAANSDTAFIDEQDYVESSSVTFTTAATSTLIDVFAEYATNNTTDICRRIEVNCTNAVADTMFGALLIYTANLMFPNLITNLTQSLRQRFVNNSNDNGNDNEYLSLDNLTTAFYDETFIRNNLNETTFALFATHNNTSDFINNNVIMANRSGNDSYHVPPFIMDLMINNSKIRDKRHTFSDGNYSLNNNKDANVDDDYDYDTYSYDYDDSDDRQHNRLPSTDHLFDYITSIFAEFNHTLNQSSVGELPPNMTHLLHAALNMSLFFDTTVNETDDFRNTTVDVLQMFVENVTRQINAGNDGYSVGEPQVPCYELVCEPNTTPEVTSAVGVTSGVSTVAAPFASTTITANDDDDDQDHDQDHDYDDDDYNNTDLIDELFRKDYAAHSLDSDTKRKLRKLCWETMFGQELVKLTVMDLVFTITSTMVFDFFRALFVRFMNKCWCWDLEKSYPKYGDFKIAENILHLVYNQGMVWMGMFFSPGLAILNLAKLVVIMYLRSWAVLTCNVPHEVVFRASRSNNFYLALLLTMLFLCVLPVGYAIVWLEPSWHCGPFSDHRRIYYLFTEALRNALPKPLHKPLDYIASPSTVIPLLLLLILIIYYLVSLTGALREANQDLKNQLRRERTEERKKMLCMTDAPAEAGMNTNGVGATVISARWRKVLDNNNTAITQFGYGGGGGGDNATGDEDDLQKMQARKDLFARLMKKALRKSSGTSDDETVPPPSLQPSPLPRTRRGQPVDPSANDDETDTEQHDSLPHDHDYNKCGDNETAYGNGARTRRETHFNIAADFRPDAMKKSRTSATSVRDNSRDRTNGHPLSRFNVRRCNDGINATAAATNDGHIFRFDDETLRQSRTSTKKLAQVEEPVYAVPIRSKAPAQDRSAHLTTTKHDVDSPMSGHRASTASASIATPTAGLNKFNSFLALVKEAVVVHGKRHNDNQDSGNSRRNSSSVNPNKGDDDEQAISPTVCARRQDSLASIWSDNNIPVITISKTESAERIFELPTAK